MSQNYDGCTLVSAGVGPMLTTSVSGLLNPIITIGASPSYGYSISVGNNVTLTSTSGNIYNDLVAIDLARPAVSSSIDASIAKLENIQDEELSDSDENDVHSTDNACVVCMVNKRIVVLQCGHRQLCAACTVTLLRGQQSSQKCPTCREQIAQAFRVFE